MARSTRNKQGTMEGGFGHVKFRGCLLLKYRTHGKMPELFGMEVFWMFQKDFKASRTEDDYC